MTFTERDIEWIVVEVVRRLGLLEGQRVAVSECNSSTADLTLAEKVVTLRSIEGRLMNITKVIVSPRAVVTPAVRDALKQHQIALIRQA